MDNLTKRRVADWFETSIKYAKILENGCTKTVTEKYVIDAVSFSEAETTIIKEMQPYISGDFSVAAIQRAPYKEIFFSEDATDDRWYKVKVAFIAIDEKGGKEKRSNVSCLIQAKSLESAKKKTDNAVNNGSVDLEIVAITETKILDVFEHELSNE